MGLTEKTEALHLANAFSAQEPQNCVVVGGGNQIQELEWVEELMKWKK